MGVLISGSTVAYEVILMEVEGWLAYLAMAFSVFILIPDPTAILQLTVIMCLIALFEVSLALSKRWCDLT